MSYNEVIIFTWFVFTAKYYALIVIVAAKF